MKKPEDMILVIFGATGDLAYRKLIPALFALDCRNMLPEKFSILGVGRSDQDDNVFRSRMEEGINKFADKPESASTESLDRFITKLSYFRMDMKSAEDYLSLKNHLEDIKNRSENGRNILFYLAMPPAMFSVISDGLGESGLSRSEEGFRRLIIEKPFGSDLESGRELNRILHRSFEENQLYRIDHYLGKETVQNLLVMRFGNGVFEPLWNRNYVHHVEITSAESIGMEGRGDYYESSGALRDMLQNHLMQVVGLVAMEPPSSMEPDSIRNETMKVFQSLRPLSEEDVPRQVIRGQYISSEIGGKVIPGYREENEVDPSSRTETFVAMKFYIDNWRWGNVPFYVRTGKMLPTKVTEVVIHFHPTPHKLFKDNDTCNSCNQLIIRIQPDEGILLKIGMKEPGAGFNVRSVNMDFHYADLTDIHLPSAYERLLFDAMKGDSTLFSRADAVEAAWKFVAPVQKVWSSDPEQKIYGYPAGTWGPEIAHKLIEGSKTGWRFPCDNLTGNETYCEL
ncbi:MAG: glucose-6-phosphate dehydrogenase [Bacteroidales bacterium]|nr:glucose-6-phosphate dehydrogenase [Bacteroidales bacterium]